MIQAKPIRGRSLRARLLLWSGTATGITLVLAAALVDVAFRGNIRDQLEEGLTFARQVAEDTRRSQVDVQISEAVNVALDTRLRAAVATEDPATVRQTLEEVFPADDGWAVVVGSDGAVLASTGSAPTIEISRADALLAEAAYFDTGDLWLVGDTLVDVAASAVLFGASPLATLVVGRPVQPERVIELEAAAGRTVALVTDNQIILGRDGQRLPPEARQTLIGWHRGGGEDVEMIRLGSERFFSTRSPLPSMAGSEPASLVVLGSYDVALAPADALRTTLVTIFFAGLLLTFGVSSVFSRAITVPIGRLLHETARLAQGDLEQPIALGREDEIGRLAESFEDMRVSLKVARTELIRAERLSAIGNAASAVAHDFTQPLSTISGAIGLLRMDGESQDVRDRCFAAIEGELDRLGRMKQEIVEFARGEATLDEADVRIDSFLENTVSALRTQLASDDITLTVDHGYEGNWYIDSYRLGRVVENLIRNAAAAIGSQGSVLVRSEHRDGWLVIQVEDDGPGIPADQLEDIFEPFVSYGKKEGTGLGLAIARNVLQQHGGSIEVVSNTETTRFDLRLPPRADQQEPHASVEVAGAP